MSAEKLEQTIGIVFHDKDLLMEALTHRSYLNENASWRVSHNERLEYLGDAVLELIISEALFRKFPNFPEGQLTLLRAALVNYQMLALVAQEMDLDQFLLMSKGERGDSKKAKEVILANAFEAFVGAVYLDQGFSVAEKFIKKMVFEKIDGILEAGTYKDPKSELQEIVQEKFKVTPTYEVIAESGPAHERIFRVAVLFGEKRVAEGEGSSKQEAELEAAREALKGLDAE